MLVLCHILTSISVLLDEDYILAVFLPTPPIFQLWNNFPRIQITNPQSPKSVAAEDFKHRYSYSVNSLCIRASISGELKQRNSNNACSIDFVNAGKACTRTSRGGGRQRAYAEEGFGFP